MAAESCITFSAFVANSHVADHFWGDSFKDDDKVQLMQEAAEIVLPETVPKEYCCPITYCIMSDPVTIDETKQTYERQAILKWFEKCTTEESGFTDPMTNVKLKNIEYYANGKKLPKISGNIDLKHKINKFERDLDKKLWYYDQKMREEQRKKRKQKQKQKQNLQRQMLGDEADFNCNYQDSIKQLNQMIQEFKESKSKFEKESILAKRIQELFRSMANIFQQFTDSAFNVDSVVDENYEDKDYKDDNEDKDTALPTTPSTLDSKERAIMEELDKMEESLKLDISKTMAQVKEDVRQQLKQSDQSVTAQDVEQFKQQCQQQKTLFHKLVGGIAWFFKGVAKVILFLVRGIVLIPVYCVKWLVRKIVSWFENVGQQ